LFISLQKFKSKKMTTIGYFEEFMINGKFIGTQVCKEQTRTIGYYGKETKIANQDIILNNKKKIKKGQEYYTRYYPLNGR
jgi:hypothetical protein